MTLITAAAVAVAVAAVWLAWTLYKHNRALNRRLEYRARPWPAAPPKTPEEEQDERLSAQLLAVTRPTVKFSSSRVMGRGEYELFRAAVGVTGQPFPTGNFPFFIFPQVALGQIIRTTAPMEWQADHAHRAINSKRCDLLIADRNGNPVAVLEFQGSGHDIGGTAKRRDQIKRIALQRAGVRYVEIRDGATQAEIQQIIRSLLTPAASTAATFKAR
jgi:hypothetical protein